MLTLQDIMALQEQNLNESKSREQTLTERLNSRRQEMGGLNQVAAQRKTDALEGNTAVPMSPGGAFNAFQTFLSATENATQPLTNELSEERATQSNLLAQLAQLASTQQGGVSIGDQLKALESGYQIVDGQLIPLGEGGVITDKVKKDLLEERKTRLEQNLSTDDIDAKLRQAGVFTDDGSRKQVVDIIDQILAEQKNLEALYGDLRSGGVPLINRGKVQATKAKLDRLMNMLTVEERAKLKGSGQISDKETEMLENAVSTLGNKKQDTATVIAELNRIKSEMNKDIFGGSTEDGEGNEESDPLGIL